MDIVKGKKREVGIAFAFEVIIRILIKAKGYGHYIR